MSLLNRLANLMPDLPAGAVLAGTVTLVSKNYRFFLLLSVYLSLNS